MGGISLPNLRGGMVAAAIAAGVGLLALIFAVVNQVTPLLSAAVPALLISGIACARWPAAASAGVLFLSGAYGTLQVMFGVPGGVLIDLLLVGLWLGVIGSHVFGRREQPWWIWPGVALVCLYILVTFFEIATAPSAGLGAQSFRYATWYLMAIPLFAMAGWSLATYERISKAMIAVTLLIGAYAAFRLVVGPSEGERLLALSSAGSFNTIDGGDISLIGSLPNRHTLAFWTTCAAPFCLAAAMVRQGWWMLAGLASVLLAGVAAFGTDVRAVIPALLAGMLLVVVLFQISGGARSSAVMRTGVVALVAVGGGVALFFAVVGENSSRYGALVDPGQDLSYLQHIGKWEAALEDMEGEPFGKGLATAGRIAEEGQGPYVTVGSYAIDSSYLKVAYEQGFPVLALFIGSLLVLLIGIARRSVSARTPEARALAIGASGTLVAALAMFVTGQYIEDVSALPLWMLAGAAVGALSAERFEARRDARDEAGQRDSAGDDAAAALDPSRRPSGRVPAPAVGAAQLSAE